MKRDISKKRLLPYPIERVWDCITNPDYLHWLFEAEIDLKEGGKIKWTDSKKKITITGEILTVQEPINFAFSWVDPSLPFTTYVWWKLMSKDGGTLLELEHSGFKGIKGLLSSYTYTSFWANKFRKLDEALNKRLVDQS